MARFDDYAQAYQSIRMERRNGILQLTLHTNGAALQWGNYRIANYPRHFGILAATRTIKS